MFLKISVHFGGCASCYRRSFPSDLFHPLRSGIAVAQRARGSFPDHTLETSLRKRTQSPRAVEHGSLTYPDITFPSEVVQENLTEFNLVPRLWS